MVALPDDTKIVRGIPLRNDPAREDCFEIVHLHSELVDFDSMSLESRQERMHREFNSEVQTLEIAAQCLTDFPDAPWELRLALARQCWDEARHTALFYRRLIELGGWKGQFPIANLDWSIVCMIESLAARLAVQHRTFEAGSLDVIRKGVTVFQEAGDRESSEILDAIDADEIPHVWFANQWIKRLTDEEPRNVMKIAQAVAWLRKVVAATGGDTMHEIATNVESREMAGFSSSDVAEVSRIERSLADRVIPEVED